MENEHFPKATYSPETQESNEVMIEKAEAVNAERPFWKKVIGKDKVTGMDMLRDEADRINQMVDDARYSDVFHEEDLRSRQEIADAIIDSAEFHPSAFDAENFSFTEYLRKKNPLILEQIQHLNIENAARLAEEFENEWEQTNAESSFSEELADAIGNRIRSAIAANNILRIRMMLESGNAEVLARWVSPDLIPSFPQEVLSNTAYRDKLIFMLKRSGKMLNEDSTHVLALLEKAAGEEAAGR